MFGFKDIGLGMGGGSGRLAIGFFLPVPMPNGFPVTGDVIQVGGVGFLETGDIGDVMLLTGSTQVGGNEEAFPFWKRRDNYGPNRIQTAGL